MGVGPILRAEDLTKTYGAEPVRVTALRGADMAVAPGEFVAIMGPSGSGKSTLLHLLGGLDTATSGRIFIRDIEITGLNDKQLTLVRRREVGFVFQTFNLLPTLSAEENVMIPVAIGKRSRGSQEEYKDRLDRLFTLVGMNERRRHRPDQLSGGEQQRVAIARALVTEPAIIFADEPTGNLDRRHGREVLGLLRRSAAETGQTILMVTHDPTAAVFADRVIFLSDGAIVRELQLGGDDNVEAVIASLAELGD